MAACRDRSRDSLLCYVLATPNRRVCAGDSRLCNDDGWNIGLAVDSIASNHGRQSSVDVDAGKSRDECCDAPVVHGNIGGGFALRRG